MKAFEIKHIAVYDKDIGPDRAADLLWESLTGGKDGPDRPVAVRVEDVAVAENADEVLAELARDRRKFDWIPDGVTEIPVVREASGATVKAVDGATVAPAEPAPAEPAPAEPAPAESATAGLARDAAPVPEPAKRRARKAGDKRPARKRKGDAQ